MLRAVRTKLNFIRCAVCAGNGVWEERICRACKGRGVLLALADKFLHWDRELNPQNLFFEKIERKAKIIFNIFLVVIGLSGIILMAYLGYLDNFQSFFSLKYWLTPGLEKFYFWLTLLIDLYLYYRLEQENAPRYRVLTKKFSTSDSFTPASLSWQDVSADKLVDAFLAFSEEAKRAVESAWELAKHFNHHEVKRLHLFAVLFQFDKSAIIFARLGINFEHFKRKITACLSGRIIGRGGEPQIALELRQLLLAAYAEAWEAKKEKVELDDLFLALASPEQTEIAGRDDVKEILLEFDLNYQKVKNVIDWIRIQEALRRRLEHFRGRARYKPKGKLDRAMIAVATPYLDQFSEDLTLQAKHGQFFPCLGREKEFENIFRIFEGSRQGALLVGPQGVGRTAIIRGLAERMVTEDVPEILRDKRLVSLNIAALVAGVSASSAEERLINIINEVVEAGNIVLAVENLHYLSGIGAGQEVGLDLSEVFAELLGRGLFYCAATTTPYAFVAVIENKALDAVFQNVQVEELEMNDAICVLEARSGPIEYQNKVYFSYGAIEKSAIMSAKYIHNRYLPEKAIEILEQTAAKVWREKGENKIVSANDVAEIVSAMTKIPLAAITEKESEKLMHLEEKIHERMIDQEEAVKIVAASLRRARVELRESKRPIASLLFLGPTGVGKTELAKTVAEVYFGDEKNMLRLDMSEFQSADSINRLIGNGRQAGILTEGVRQRPFSLVLFDEAEKAHPDILNLFLQVLDDGRLTDSRGQVIDFTNTIIIMTSNAGAIYIQDEIKKGTAIGAIKNYLVNEELRKHFRPEFLNRFDGIVVFRPLAMVEVIKIAHLLLSKIVKQLEEKGIEFTAKSEAAAELAEMGFDQKFGARPLRRVIQEHVNDALANYLLRGELKRRDKVTLEVGGKLRIEKAEEI